MEGMSLKMGNCCGGGCGTSYRKNEVLEMLETLKVIEESGILTKPELDQLFRAVITYNENDYEVK